MGSRYVARIGMSYVPKGGQAEVRREIGDGVDDLPDGAVAGLLEAGAIEAAAATEAGGASSKEE